MKTDQDGLRLEMDRVGDDVSAFGDVERRVLIDGFLDGGSIVTDAVTFYAERAEVYPGIDRRQQSDDVIALRRQRVRQDAR